MASDVAAHHATLFKILLVILFGLPERSRWNNLSCDGLAIRSGGVKLGDLRAGLGKLLVGMGEDDAAILRAPIRTLAIHLGGIVHREERIQQRLVGKAGWIESDLNDLRMACAVCTNFFISWVFEIAAFVSYGRVDNTCDLSKTGLYSPKTSCSKRCFFSCHSAAP
jgi:hypothetical protein